MPQNGGWWTLSDIFTHTENLWLHHRGTKLRCFIFLCRNHPCTGSVLCCVRAFQKNKKTEETCISFNAIVNKFTWFLQWFCKWYYFCMSVSINGRDYHSACSVCAFSRHDSCPRYGNTLAQNCEVRCGEHIFCGLASHLLLKPMIFDLHRS